jgi:MOSC domain-containing protein YiiM
MFNGELIGICLAREAGGAMRSVAEVRVVPGKGLEGDRYFEGKGTWTGHPGNGREVTLIEMEAIAAIRLESAIELEPGDARRNLITRGVPLNHLVGKEFRIGDVVLRGMRLCEPCSYMESKTRAGVKAALKHRAGLRAEAVTGGVIRVGDAIREGAGK